MIRERSTKAFTVLELIVVLVILGILALLAVPSYERVMVNTHNRSTEITLSSYAREVQSLAALEGRDAFTVADITAASVDLPSVANASGAYAALAVELVQSPTPAERDTDSGVASISYHVGPGGSSAGLAMVSAANYCIGVHFTPSSTTVVPMPEDLSLCSGDHVTGAPVTPPDDEDPDVPSDEDPDEPVDEEPTPPGDGNPAGGVTPPNTSGQVALTYDLSAPGCENLAIDVPVEGAAIGTVFWGDGTSSPLSSFATHTYPNASTYILTITGTFSHLQVGDADAACVTSLNNWSGNTGTTSTEYAFRNAINLDSAVMPPTTVTSMKGMFKNATSLNQDISSWNVSNVTDMSEMFEGATSFNQPLDPWDVSKVTSMKAMFKDATAFNHHLASWNVSNVTDMSEMFLRASTFYGFVNDWDVSKVTNMSYMFADAEMFDQDLSQWNTGSVETTEGMFAGSAAFNQPIGMWNVSNVNNMSMMFWNTSAFDQPLANWDISNVTNMSMMFEYAEVFNQDLSSWQVAHLQPTQYHRFSEGANLWAYPKPLFN